MKCAFPQLKMQQEQEKLIRFPEIEIPRLIYELGIINNQNYQYLDDKISCVYNRLYESYLLNEKEIAEIKETPDLDEQDLIALCQGVGEIFSYYPRPIQLMAVILLFNHEQNKGRLAQIYTGEGKTLIVAMLAVLLVKKKKVSVDIVTSSPVLAKRDAEELVKFYEQFKLKVSHNIETNPILREGKQPCYDANIVYGDTHSFEADILRHEYSELGTRGDRKLEYAIIDEVDSMLIDGINFSTFLSSPMPGMLDITKILRLIWDEICKVEGNIIKRNHVLIYNDNKMYEVDLKEYICKTLDIQIKEAMAQLMLPYRLDYIHFMKETWIDSAIGVKYLLELNQNYIIEKGKVRIVDFENTGVIHNNNMQWQDGIHQFVQLKHKLDVTPLLLTTNFMSNFCFFQRYKSNIIGLTGTLGSIHTRNLLAKKYNVDFIMIPHNKVRLLRELPGKALESEEEWLKEIKRDITNQLSQNRSILIINQSIRDARLIEQNMHYQDTRISIYTDDSQQIEKQIGVREIIIATNLAGRGTDLITNEELEFNGGLHVIVTFLPRNIRIQEQAFGRTSRQGRRGTARLIIQSSKSFLVSEQQQMLTQIDLIQQYLQNNQNAIQGNLEMLDVVKYHRDLNEEDQMKQMDKEMQILVNEEECFQTFCAIAKSLVSKRKQPALFKSLEEKWGIYFEINKQKGLKKEDIERVVNETTQNPKFKILQSLENNSGLFLENASSVANSDPAYTYYKGCFELKKLKHENLRTGVQILQQAKQQFQAKIDNEQGCNLSFTISQVQMHETQQVNEQDDLIMQNEQGQRNQQNFDLASYERNVEFQPLFENLNRPQFVQVNQQAQVQAPQVNSVTLDSQTRNRIGVYKRFINNIDEMTQTIQNFNPNEEELDFEWISTLDRDSFSKSENINSELEDQRNVVIDGPLPQMGKIKKRNKPKKKLKWWAMLLIGIIQFIAGCIICACTAGAAFGVGIYLIKEGISDMVLAITSQLRGIDIDWGGWGQRKVISFCSVLTLAGPAAIKDAFTVAEKAFKSIALVGLSSLLACQGANFQGLQQIGKWLPNNEKDNLQKQYEAIKKIGNKSQQYTNRQQILQMAKQILDEQIQGKQIQKPTAKEIEELVEQALLQSQESGIPFKRVLISLCGKFLHGQMAKLKSQSELRNIQNNINEVWERKGSDALETFSKQIDLYKQKQQLLNTQLTNFPQMVIQCLGQDEEIQKILLGMELIQKNQNLFRNFPKLTSNQILEYYQKTLQDYTISIPSHEMENLNLSNPTSVNQFYWKHVRGIILNIAKEICSFEPLAILLFEKNDQELKLTIERMRQLQQNLKANQINVNDLITDNLKNVNFSHCVGWIETLKTLGLVNRNGVTFSNSINEEFEQLIKSSRLPYVTEQTVIQAFAKAVESSKTIENAIQKTLSVSFLNVIQTNLIEQLEQDIFNSKMQALEKSQLETMNYQTVQ